MLGGPGKQQLVAGQQTWRDAGNDEEGILGIKIIWWSPRKIFQLTNLVMKFSIQGKFLRQPGTKSLRSHNNDNTRCYAVKRRSLYNLCCSLHIWENLCWSSVSQARKSTQVRELPAHLLWRVSLNICNNMVVLERTILDQMLQMQEAMEWNDHQLSPLSTTLCQKGLQKS